MPMSPDCGTQNIMLSIAAPARYSGAWGPGTLVMTAVAFLASVASNVS